MRKEAAGCERGDRNDKAGCAGGEFLVYPGVREGNGVGTFSRARRWSPPLVRDGEREQCCGGEERGGAAEGGVLVLVAAAGCCDCIVQ